MASKPTVTLTFAGDSVDLEKKFNDVGREAAGLEGDFGKAEQGAEDLEKAFREVGSAAESTTKVEGLNTALVNSAAAGDVAERGLIAVADTMGFMTNQLGIGSPLIEEWTRGFADLGGAAASLIPLMGQAPQFIAKVVTQTAAGISAAASDTAALIAQAAAFVAANAPIIIIIGSIALLAAGIVLLIKHWDTIVEKVPGLGAAIDLAKDALGFLTDAFQGVLDFLTDHWPEVATILSGPFAPLVLLATDAFGVRSALEGAFDAALSFGRQHWPEIATIISGPFAPLVLLATDAFGVRSALEGAFTSAKDFISERINDIVGFILDLPTRVSAAASGAFDAVSDAFISALNTIIDKWNGLKIPGFSLGSFSLPEIDTHIPGVGTVGGGTLTLPSIPDIELPDIPRLHAGGVVPGTPSQEMLALLRGGERVVPNAVGNLTVNVSALSPRAAADAVIEAINEFERRNGRRFART